MLDTLVVVDRAGKVVNRAHSVTLSQVSSVVEKPRRFYLSTLSQSTGGMGAPAFRLDGKLVGVYVLRAIRSNDHGGGSMFGMFGGMQDSMAMILLPAVEIQDGAAQAPPREDAAEE